MRQIPQEYRVRIDPFHCLVPGCANEPRWAIYQGDYAKVLLVLKGIERKRPNQLSWDESFYLCAVHADDAQTMQRIGKPRLQQLLYSLPPDAA